MPHCRTQSKRLMSESESSEPPEQIEDSDQDLLDVLSCNAALTSKDESTPVENGSPKENKASQSASSGESKRSWHRPRKRGTKHGKPPKDSLEKKELASIALTEEHIGALDLIIKEGKNVFITGGAGTGKSVVLQKLKQILPPHTTFVTASTGAAAVNIGGTTVHQFAGIGTGEMSAQELYFEVQKNNAFAQWRWNTAKVLIIDEISMISADTFHKLNFLAKTIRRNKKPFGGIQLDWGECIDKVVQFTRVFRQANDPLYARLLSEIRFGICSSETTSVMYRAQARAAKCEFDDSIEPTRLYSLNRDVNKVNTEHLEALPGRGKHYVGIDKGAAPEIYTLKRSCRAPLHLYLKIGAQVMLLRNLEVQKGLVNGARGVVVDWNETRKQYPIVQFSNGLKTTIEPVKFTLEMAGVIKASRRQVPLSLAWAMSIHKSQGTTLDRAQISLSYAFQYGQVYVALSRIASLRGLYLLGFNPNSIKAHPKVIDYYNSLNLKKDTQASKGTQDSLEPEEHTPDSHSQANNNLEIIDLT